jgi:hypothetical protein
MNILPGYDSKNYNTNSFLFKTYKENCSEYVLDKPLESQESIISLKEEQTVVHSYGFFIFLAAYQKGLIQNTKSLIVFDGWFPTNCKFMEDEVKIVLPNIPMIFFFPTFGDRREYSLESIVRQQMATRKDIIVIRGLGFGHNLLFGEFTEKKVTKLVIKCIKLSYINNLVSEFYDDDTSDDDAGIRPHLPASVIMDLKIRFPHTKITY